MAGIDRNVVDDEVPRIVCSPEVLGGDPRIEGTRVGVVHVLERHDAGDDPEDIAESFGVSRSEVHAALAYAFTHPEQVASLRARDRNLLSSIERPVPPE